MKSCPPEIKFEVRLAGYHAARYIGEWNGYEVYEPYFTDNINHCIGFPQFLLCAKNGELHWSNPMEESPAIMNEFRSKRKKSE